MRPSRTPPPLASSCHASPRHAAPRRGIEPSRAHSYALLFAGQERRVFDRWGHDLRRRIVGYRLGRGFSPCLSTRGRTYICGALPTLAVTKTERISASAPTSFLCCCCRRRLHPVHRRRESRPPKPRLSGSCTGRGAIRFLGSDYATARFCSSTSASSSSSPCRPTPTVPPLRGPRPTSRPPRMPRLLSPPPPPRGRLEGIHRLSLSCFFLL